MRKKIHYSSRKDILYSVWILYIIVLLKDLLGYNIVSVDVALQADFGHNKRIYSDEWDTIQTLILN